MTFFRDKQIKGYLLFIFSYSVLLLGGVIFFCQNQVSVAKSMYLEHDTAIVSALLERGRFRRNSCKRYFQYKYQQRGDRTLKYDWNEERHT